MLQGSGQFYLLDATTVESSTTNCLQTRRHLYLRNGPFILKLTSRQRGIQHTAQVHFYQIGHTLQVIPVISIEFSAHVDFVDFLQITGFIQRKQPQFTGGSHVNRDFHRRFGHNQHVAPLGVDAIGMECSIGNSQLPTLSCTIRTIQVILTYGRSLGMHCNVSQIVGPVESIVANILYIFGQLNTRQGVIVVKSILSNFANNIGHHNALNGVLAI